VDCEAVSQGDRREGPNVSVLTRTARVDGAGVLRVRLALRVRSVERGVHGPKTTQRSLAARAR
jgi:hypothetical protein